MQCVSIPAALLLMCCLAAVSCQGPVISDTQLPQEFRDYWFNGEAEVASFALKQARYGEIRSGEAVLIFVTEDFLTDKQVKYEYGDRGDDITTVLKLNLTRNFNTGIYPYSVMSSVFTPVNDPAATLKISTSVQEWCGHTYAQLNRRRGHFEGVLHSYFQDEADQQFTLEAIMTEDEIWTRIRLAPAELPVGEIRIIPGTQFLRFSHQPFELTAAVAEMNEVRDSMLSQEPLKQYSLEYRDFTRTLKITFERDFPHEIVAWEETTESGFSDPKVLTTTALRMQTMRSAYWEKNSVQDTVLRMQLGLE